MHRNAPQRHWSLDLTEPSAEVKRTVNAVQDLQDLHDLRPWTFASRCYKPLPASPCSCSISSLHRSRRGVDRRGACPPDALRRAKCSSLIQSTIDPALARRAATQCALWPPQLASATPRVWSIRVTWYIMCPLPPKSWGGALQPTRSVPGLLLRLAPIGGRPGTRQTTMKRKPRRSFEVQESTKPKNRSRHLGLGAVNEPPTC
jgi:hypothetical protein